MLKENISVIQYLFKVVGKIYKIDVLLNFRKEGSHHTCDSDSETTRKGPEILYELRKIIKLQTKLYIHLYPFLSLLKEMHCQLRF